MKKIVSVLGIIVGVCLVTSYIKTKHNHTKDEEDDAEMCPYEVEID